MFVRPTDPEAADGAAPAAEAAVAPLKAPTAAQAVSAALVVRTAAPCITLTQALSPETHAPQTPRGRATLILAALLCLLLGASLLAPPVQDKVLSVHLHPPAAEMDAAAAARVAVLRLEVAAKRELAPRTHGKGHRAHRSRDAGAKDKLKQLRMDAQGEDEEEHKHEHHHHHHDDDGGFEGDESSDEAR